MKGRSFRGRAIGTLAVLAAALATSACDRESGPSREGAAASALAPYPLGRWRLASDLRSVRLAVSHILIAHKDSAAPLFRIFCPAPQPRSRTSALQQAMALHRQLLDNPALFDDLARAQSDDRASAPFKGYLGTVQASLLSMVDPKLVDALATLSPGEVSRIVESSEGFHILRREPVPAERLVAAHRLLIRHADSPSTAPGIEKSDRSWEQARRLAEKLRARAIADPKRFDALLRENSEGADADRLGDTGVWSTHENTLRALFTHVLSETPPGGIAPLVETIDGFEIARRMPTEGRPRYAARYLRIPFREPAEVGAEAGAEVSTLPGSSEARQLATRLARELREAPERFEALGQQNCLFAGCTGAGSWSQGRGNPAFEQALAGVPVGHVAGPIEAGAEYVLLQKLAPRDGPPEREAYVYVLPSPEPRPVEQVIADVPNDVAAEGLRRLRVRGEQSLELSERERARFVELLEATAGAVERASPNERAALAAGFRADLYALLGPERSAAFQRLRDEEVRAYQFAQ